VERQPARPAAPLDWKHLVQRVAGSHPQLGLFLEMGVPVKAEGDEVIIGFPKTASMALDKMQKEDTHRLVAGVCAELVGRPIRLRVVELSDDHPAAVLSAHARAAQERADKQALLERARAHPLVRQALEMFGGDVIEVRENSPRKEVQS
jgi:DNA polymerase-3 subunit gamma/tau